MASSGMTFSLVPACKHADGHHGGLGGRDLARDDGLQPHDRRCRHHDRIDAGLRHRAMRAAPEQADLQAVGRRRDRPGAPGDRARGPTITCWPSTTSGFGKRVNRPSSIIARAPWPSPRPAGTARSAFRARRRALREKGGCAHQPRHVHVVAAGMRHRHRLAARSVAVTVLA